MIFAYGSVCIEINFDAQFVSGYYRFLWPLIQETMWFAAFAYNVQQMFALILYIQYAACCLQTRQCMILSNLFFFFFSLSFFLHWVPKLENDTKLSVCSLLLVYTYKIRYTIQTLWQRWKAKVFAGKWKSDTPFWCSPAPVPPQPVRHKRVNTQTRHIVYVPQNVYYEYVQIHKRIALAPEPDAGVSSVFDIYAYPKCLIQRVHSWHTWVYALYYMYMLLQTFSPKTAQPFPIALNGKTVNHIIVSRIDCVRWSASANAMIDFLETHSLRFSHCQHGHVFQWLRMHSVARRVKRRRCMWGENVRRTLLYCFVDKQRCARHLHTLTHSRKHKHTHTLGVRIQSVAHTHKHTHKKTHPNEANKCKVGERDVLQIDNSNSGSSSKEQRWQQHWWMVLNVRCACCRKLEAQNHGCCLCVYICFGCECVCVCSILGTL